MDALVQIVFEQDPKQQCCGCGKSLPEGHEHCSMCDFCTCDACMEDEMCPKCYDDYWYNFFGDDEGDDEDDSYDFERDDDE